MKKVEKKQLTNANKRDIIIRHSPRGEDISEADGTVS